MPSSRPYLFVVRSHGVAALDQRPQLDNAQVDGHEGVSDAVHDQHQVLHALVEVQIQVDVVLSWTVRPVATGGWGGRVPSTGPVRGGKWQSPVLSRLHAQAKLCADFSVLPRFKGKGA